MTLKKGTQSELVYARVKHTTITQHVKIHWVATPRVNTRLNSNSNILDSYWQQHVYINIKIVVIVINKTSALHPSYILGNNF